MLYRHLRDPRFHHCDKRVALAQESLQEPPAVKGPPVLGESIPWRRVEGHYLRVRWCTFLASIEDGTFRPTPMGSYAALGVECPSLAIEAFIVVSNHVDFLHLWELYVQRQVADDEEVLLVYAPVTQARPGTPIGMSLPCLDIMVYPKGHLEQAYDPEFSPLSREVWLQEKARWKPLERRKSVQDGRQRIGP